MQCPSTHACVLRSCRHRPAAPCLRRPPRRSPCSRAAMRASATAEAPQAAAAPVAQPKGYKAAIVLQSFGWDSCDKGGFYRALQSRLGDIKQMAVTHMWLPPPSQSVSPQGYMPGQLYNLNSKYGTEEELVALVKAAKELGIICLADIVINHRCADEMVDGRWNKFRDDVTHDGKRIDWGKWAITSNDPAFGGTGNPDTGEDYGPAPDLDHLNPDLRAALKDWLGWLQRGIGFGGWRLDFVKGYAARFVDEYIAATVTGDALCVAEYWTDMKWNGSELAYDQDAARQVLCDWINGTQKTCTAFDFPTKGILQEAIKRTELWRLKDKDGKPPGLLGWWPARAVTFIANHDTDSTQRHWPFPDDHVAAGYAYIMSHPGMPCVFCDHILTWGAELRDTITALAALRRRNNIVADSPIKILAAEADLYVAEINSSVVLKLGPRMDMGPLLPKEAEGWRAAVWGKDFCLWERHSGAAAAAGGSSN